MRYETTENLSQLYFENFSEFIEKISESFVSKPNYNAMASLKNRSFSHVSSLAEAQKLATKGWPEGREKFKALADKLDITSHVLQPELYFDTTGDYGYDMARVMSGEPESVMSYFETEDMRESSNGPIVKIVVNVVASAMVEVPLLIAKGSAIMALIDALETAGKRVELKAIYRIGSNFNSRLIHHIEIPLKNLDYHAQYDQICYALAHPSFMRGFCFQALSTMGIDGKKSAEFNCGSFTDYARNNDKKPADTDIYISGAYGLDVQWQKLEAAEAWIKAQLELLGVTLDNA
jgi:hypothetical protein